jgi:dihydroflavonol-4-reductase
VRVLVRADTRALEGVDVERVNGDLASAESLSTLFRGVDWAFHAAAHISITGSDGGKTELTNVDGARNAAFAALRAGVQRYVHFSSVHAFQHTAGPTVDETSPRADEVPSAAYDRSKVGGERAVQEAVAKGLNAVIVNPAAVIGPHDYKPSRMGEVLQALYRGKLPGLVRGGFDWVDVRDVVSGAIAAAERGRVGEAYILSGNFATMEEFAATFAKVSGRPAPRFVSPLWLARVGLPFSALQSKITGARPLFTAESLSTVAHGKPCSHAKAARELGYTARSLEETLRDTLDWFLTTGRLNP